MPTTHKPANSPPKQQSTSSIVITTLFATVIIFFIAVGLFVDSGLYNISADDPHSKPLLTLIKTLRARSIQVHAKALIAPNLEDQQLILKGAGQYAAMCTSCHLTPALKDSETRTGLYPKPPNLAEQRFDPKEEFWVIKHGIKMSGMPAWGVTHDDATIWAMVAFLQKLPKLSAQEYKDIVAKAPPDDDMDMDNAAGKDNVPQSNNTSGSSAVHRNDMQDNDTKTTDMKSMIMSGNDRH